MDSSWDIITESDGLTVIRVWGLVTREGFAQCLQDLWHQPRGDLLFDLSRIKLDSSFTRHDLEQLLKLSKDIVDKSPQGSGGKSAFVTPPDLLFGLLRMAEALSEISSYRRQLRPFRNEAEARAWLASQEEG